MPTVITHHALTADEMAARLEAYYATVFRLASRVLDASDADVHTAPAA